MVERVKSERMMNYTFLSGPYWDSEVTVAASDERNARRKAMCHLWGIIPDNVCPHAPNYEGHGLILKCIKPYDASSRLNAGN